MIFFFVSQFRHFKYYSIETPYVQYKMLVSFQADGLIHAK